MSPHASHQHTNLLFDNSLFFEDFAISILQIFPCLVKVSNQHFLDSLALIFMMSLARSPTGHITTVNQNW